MDFSHFLGLGGAFFGPTPRQGLVWAPSPPSPHDLWRQIIWPYDLLASPPPGPMSITQSAFSGVPLFPFWPMKSRVVFLGPVFGFLAPRPPPPQPAALFSPGAAFLPRGRGRLRPPRPSAALLRAGGSDGRGAERRGRGTPPIRCWSLCFIRCFWF